jgi:hypothetical protein
MMKALGFGKAPLEPASWSRLGKPPDLGTWHIEMESRGKAGRIYGRVEKTWEQAQKNFFHTYVDAAKPMGIALLHSETEGFLSLVTLRVD